jgi:hypothetical protein
VLSRKDKTLVEILDRLQSLEGKIDRLPSTSHRSSQQPSPGVTARNQPYSYTSAAHKILAWPATQQLLAQSLPSSLGSLKGLEQEGAAFLIGVEEGRLGLTLEEALQDRPFVGMQSQAARIMGGERMTFPALTRDVMQRLATAYFDTFNLLYPLLDRQTFLADSMTRVLTEGFDGETDSVISLLVFALGELAIEGCRGDPIEVHEGRPSGVRGGTATRPPGLALFNEARKRIGFLLTECELENVQAFNLVAYVISFPC